MCIVQGDISVICTQSNQYWQIQNWILKQNQLTHAPILISLELQKIS